MPVSPAVLRDAHELAEDASIPWADFDGKKVAITGATGLIGQNLVATLLARAKRTAAEGRRPISVTALVRNPEKARDMFGEDENLTVVRWDAAGHGVPDGLPDEADFVFHCANMTDSASFVERPVETIETTLDGASFALAYARRTHARLLLLSTMETYGELGRDGMVAEDQGGFLDAMTVRNSYPEAKRLDEALCAAYASEYGTDVVVLRLAQTFGPGVKRDDRRVFAEFARCATAGEDIVLLTAGTKQNSYLYTSDAVRAMLFAIAKGQRGSAYNAANDATYCSVREMAELVADRFGKGGMQVRVELDPVASKRFRKGSNLRLDTSRLQGLGWKPVVPLEEMYARMIASWDEDGADA